MSLILKISLIILLELVLKISCNQREWNNNIDLDHKFVQSRELFAHIKNKRIFEHLLFLIDTNSIGFVEKSFLVMNEKISFMELKEKNDTKDKRNSNQENSTFIYNSNEGKNLQNITSSDSPDTNNKENSTFKNVTIDSSGSSVVISESKLKCLNNTNFTICINITAKNNETCIPECYLNCQVHFEEELEQKFCLLNVCKCEIFEEIIEINNTLIDITNNTQTDIIKIKNGSTLNSDSESKDILVENQTDNNDKMKFLNKDIFENDLINFKEREVLRKNEKDILEIKSNFLESSLIKLTEDKMMNQSYNVNSIIDGNFRVTEKDENNFFYIYCDILIYSLILILSVFLYFTFMMTWNQIKHTNSLNIDQRLRNIQSNESECNKISEKRNIKNPLLLQDYDLNEKLLAEQN